MAVEVKRIGLLLCDFGRKSRQKLRALDGFVGNEAGRVRWSFRFRNDLSWLRLLASYSLSSAFVF